MLSRSYSLRPAPVWFGFVVLFILLTGVGCSTDADLQVPQISFLSQSPLPSPDTICGEWTPNVFHLSGGDTIAMELLLSDNEALSQFKLDIHANFDCHGHARLADNTQDWSVLKLEDVEGKETNHSVVAIAPANPTAGAYHFQLQVVDAAGNSDPTGYIYSILLSNSTDAESPLLNISTPSPGTTLNLARGTDLIVSGTVQDNLPLGEGGNGAIKLTYIREATGNYYTAINEPLPSATGDIYAINWAYTIPTTLVPGLYTFEVQAWDGVNNASKLLSWTVNVTG